MTVSEAADQQRWDDFLGRQRFRPFLQSWTMGEVYRDTHQEPIRIEATEDGNVVGICQAIVVPARRGRHLSVPYGPVWGVGGGVSGVGMLLEALKDIARTRGCSFIRLSPFWMNDDVLLPELRKAGARPAPLHLLAEHLWYLPLVEQDPWSTTHYSLLTTHSPEAQRPRTEEEMMKDLRKTTRNLIGRARREGVTVEASTDPAADLDHFITLHEETRKRHSFTPYTNAFFRAQVERFAARKECTLYLARYQGGVIASSIHMHAFGETSYHHGASTHRFEKIPASYLLQWTAVTDALKRGDHVYNFWGIAPEGAARHPFRGVTTFKTGFGGNLLELTHCVDLPLSGSYHLTRAFENLRKWRRGF